VAVIFLLSFFGLSCGLEDIPYIDYIRDSNVTDNTSATVRLPSSSDEGYENPPVGYFVRFEIYYRIYISGEPLSGLIDTSALRRQINGSLDSDFNSLDPLTNKSNTSANPSNLDTTFNTRKFFKLTLEEDNIDNVLGRSSLGKTLEIRFSPLPGEIPVLRLNSETTYTLQRAVTGPGLNFKPEPDRYFLNHPDLYNTANVTNDINADVATNTQTTPELRFTYVSMYIFAIGKDYLTTIYSQPTHLGIFRLAEAF